MRSTLLTVAALLLAPLSGAWAQGADVPRVSGTVTTPGGAPVPGAEVLIGIHRVSDPEARNACEAGGGMLELTRAVADSRGQYEAPIPLHPHSPDANCLRVWGGSGADASPRLIAASVDHPLDAVPPAVGLVAEVVAAREGFRTPDVEAAELARGAVPGFAGIYVSACDLVVTLTDVERHGEAARAHGERLLRERTFSTGCMRDPEVRIREVEYDAAELLNWRERAGVLFSLRGAEGLGIRQRENQVSVSFSGPAARSRAERTLASLDIPKGAISLEAPEAEPDLVPFGPEEPRLGTPLAPREQITRPVWSADGTEIFWVSMVGREAVEVKALNVASGRIRTLHPDPVSSAATGRGGLSLSADGRTLYFIASARDLRTDMLYRVPVEGGRPERLADDLGWPPFAVSPDERRLAYYPRAPVQGEDRLTVVDLVTGERVTVSDHRGPLPGIIRFSPDGASLLYALTGFEPGGDGTVRIFDIERRETRPLFTLDDPRRQQIVDLRWVAGEPYLLMVEQDGSGRGSDVVEIDTTGLRRELARIPEVERVSTSGAAGWSGDGSAIALWSVVETGTWTCEVWGGPCISRRAIHYRLDLIDVHTGSVRALAEAATGQGPTWTAFSPDGARIAYRWDRGMYLEELEEE